jgi:hypothetical protein
VERYDKWYSQYFFQIGSYERRHEEVSMDQFVPFFFIKNVVEHIIPEFGHMIEKPLLRNDLFFSGFYMDHPYARHPVDHLLMCRIVPTRKNVNVVTQSR